MFDSLKITTSYLSFYCFKVLFLNLKRNFRESYVFHCLVIKVLNSPSLRQLVYFTTSFSMCQVLFSSFLNLSGEGGIWTLAPLLTTYSLSRGAPSASLGTSPNCPTQSLLIFSEAFYIISRCFSFVKNFFHLFSFSTAERVGFEPTRPCGQTVFKTASLWPLRYLSIYTFQCSPRLCQTQDVFYHQIFLLSIQIFTFFNLF